MPSSRRKRKNSSSSKQVGEKKFTDKGCEKQYKFNGKMKDLYSDKLKVELKKHFKSAGRNAQSCLKDGHSKSA